MWKIYFVKKFFWILFYIEYLHGGHKYRIYWSLLYFPVYDSLTGKVVKKLRGHKACVRDISWHPYESTILSTSVSHLKYLQQKLHTYLEGKSSWQSYYYKSHIPFQWDGSIGKWTYRKDQEDFQETKDDSDFSSSDSDDSDSDSNQGVRRSKRLKKVRHQNRQAGRMVFF